MQRRDAETQLGLAAALSRLRNSVPRRRRADVSTSLLSLSPIQAAAVPKSTGVATWCRDWCGADLTRRCAKIQTDIYNLLLVYSLEVAVILQITESK